MPRLDACANDDNQKIDLTRRDHGGKILTIFRRSYGKFFCVDGRGRGEQVHLADGRVLGFEFRCSKHNGLFDCCTRTARRAPVCVDLGTYDTKADGECVLAPIA